MGTAAGKTGPKGHKSLGFFFNSQLLMRTDIFYMFSLLHLIQAVRELYKR